MTTVNYCETLKFVETHPSPLLSCCVDNGEYGDGWYVDITDKNNTEAINVAFCKSKEVAMSIYALLKGVLQNE